MRTFYIHKYKIYDRNELDVSFISSLIRRRMSDIEKIFLYLSHSVMGEYKNFKTVFSSSWGEINRTYELIEQFHRESEFSPAKFGTSVHNAASGLFSILSKNKENYTAIAGGDNSLETGILESLISVENDVLFTFAEENCPGLYEPYLKERCSECGLSFFMSFTEKSDFKVKVDFKNSKDTNINFRNTELFLEKKLKSLIASNYVLTQENM